ncbi:tetratricopeptide repeat protein [Thalassolituus hydrocarboniclasticus]|uniref:Tetratricopeptide repeat protein n=1 Tax=Thalassolituus hydrocarboniclasticus TaxID=2742796 RepID=A0ABY6A8S1_9GAMM|nr:tetratricopeptide repeat protein [Thalassolituus hydrocarboniclasticus]UXD86558.1 hypothetical protein HUF19_03460 [Thalassolituus hydrocarboniclasticus]
MSLLHQVLQDIDKRDADRLMLPPSLQLDDSASGLNPATEYSSAVFPAHPRYRRYQPLFWLLLVLTLGIFFLSDDFSGNPENSSDLPGFIDRQAQSDSASISLKNSAPANSKQSTADLNPEKPLSSEQPVSSVPPVLTEKTMPAERTLPEQSTPAEASGQKAPAKEPELNRNVSVVRSDQQAQEYYLQAMDELSRKQFSPALEHIDQALALTVRDDYLAIKLRIYLEQKEQEKFLQLYATHASVLHPYWLAVAAPGLHLFGRYDDAARVYQQLILAQPEIVNWPLALAQALHSAGRNQQARSVLENLYQQNRLTPEQKRWVEQRLKNLR